MAAEFPSSVRLRTRREFTAVQNRGRRVSTKYMTLLAQPSDRTCDRLGITASKRLGGAVVRNRAKRRLREIFRRHRLDACAQPLDFVAIPKRELILAPFAALEADFRAAVDRLRARR